MKIQPGLAIGMLAAEDETKIKEIILIGHNYDNIAFDGIEFC